MRNKLTTDADFMHSVLDFRRISFGSHSSGVADAVLSFNTTPQPIFHKNFDLVSQSFEEYLQNGYKLYILSDVDKQTERIKTIFEDRGEDRHFTPVSHTIHEGFVDNTLKSCFFTDHQLFDRFHKYSLKSDKARSGKMTLSLKELNQFSIGDYVVHIDHASDSSVD